MPDSFACVDCPPGNEIRDHAYRVERTVKHYDEEGRLVAVDKPGGYDVYCQAHFEARKARGWA